MSFRDRIDELLGKKEDVEKTSDPAELPGVTAILDAFPGSEVERVDPLPDILDPRPDLEEDHDLWVKALAVAADGPILGLFKGWRACGARILWRGDRLFLDVAELVDAEADLTIEDMRRDWLMPNRDEITRVLDAVQSGTPRPGQPGTT